MKRVIFIAVIAIVMVIVPIVQSFGQFVDRGVRVGADGGFLIGLTQMNENDANLAGQLFLRHNITKYLDGDLALMMGQLQGAKYQTDLYLAEYKVLYKPLNFNKWEPYVGAGLGVGNYIGNWAFQPSRVSTDDYAAYLPITLGTEYALTDKLTLDANVNFSYAFSNQIVTTNAGNSGNGYNNDAWWGIFVGISYTIFGGSSEEAKKEAIRLKAEEDARHAKELADAEAKRQAAAAARIKEAKIAEAKRIQDSISAAAEVSRIKDSIDAAAKRLAESKQKVAAPKPEPPKPAAFKSEVGKAIILEGVIFQTGGAKISKESEIILESAKKTLEENPNMTVEIRGYTDNVGNVKKNLQISDQRAKAVKAWLVSKGVASKRITAKGYGVKNPIADNKTAEGRQKNRRIEFFRTK